MTDPTGKTLFDANKGIVLGIIFGTAIGFAFGAHVLGTAIGFVIGYLYDRTEIFAGLKRHIESDTKDDGDAA